MTKPIEPAMLQARIARLLHDRLLAASNAWSEAVSAAGRTMLEGAAARHADPAAAWKDMLAYGVDFAQRSALFWTRCASAATSGWSMRRPANRRSSSSPTRRSPMRAPLRARSITFCCASCPATTRRSIRAAGRSSSSTPAGHGPGIGGFKADSRWASP